MSQIDGFETRPGCGIKTQPLWLYGEGLYRISLGGLRGRVYGTDVRYTESIRQQAYKAIQTAVQSKDNWSLVYWPLAYGKDWNKIPQVCDSQAIGRLVDITLSEPNSDCYEMTATLKTERSCLVSMLEGDREVLFYPTFSTVQSDTTDSFSINDLISFQVEPV